MYTVSSTHVIAGCGCAAELGLERLFGVDDGAGDVEDPGTGPSLQGVGVNLHNTHTHSTFHLHG